MEWESELVMYLVVMNDNYCHAGIYVIYVVSLHARLLARLGAYCGLVTVVVTLVVTLGFAVLLCATDPYKLLVSRAASRELKAVFEYDVYFIHYLYPAIITILQDLPVYLPYPCSIKVKKPPKNTNSQHEISRLYR